jgi:hypothetical protein
VAGHAVGAKGEQALRILNESFNRQAEELRPFAGVFDVSLATIISGVVATGTSNSLRYDALTIARDSVRVSGSAGGWTNPESLESFLRSHGYDVRLVRKDATADGSVPFSVVTGEGAP